MRLKLLALLFFVSTVATAQVKLSGVVKDSIGIPLEMANAIAIDTVTKAITSYGFTDANGNYKLDLKRNTTYNIKISYIGFKTADDIITTKSDNITKNYTLAFDNMLDEIEIVSSMPVTIKGDTIVYNADSFKNGTERKLEDVLKKLPGVEINDNGEIEVEGKTVEKLMVNGKDFFDGDTKLATKNIPSNAVDKIEVLRNFTDVGQLSGVQDNQDRVALNIKLKEGKDNFWFGDITAGGGSSTTEGLYLFQPKLFYYNPKYSINFIGDINNLGDVVLNRNDVRNFSGGFRSQSPSNGTNISLASAGIGFLTASARNANRIETKLSALNFSFSPNKKLDLSGFIIFSNNANGQRKDVFQDYIDEDTPDDFTQTITDQTSNTGLVKLSAIYKKDLNNQLNYDVIGRFANEYRSDDVSSLVLSDITEYEKATPYKVNQNLSYFYTANEKNIFALEVQHQIQDEDPFYVAALENDPTNNNPLDLDTLEDDEDGFDDAAEVLGLIRTDNFYTLQQDRKVFSNQLNAKLDYYNILNDKSNLNFVAGTILSRQNFDSRFFQILDDGTEYDPEPSINDLDNAETINDTEYTFTDLYAGVRYRLKAGIFTFTPGFTAHAYTIKNEQISSLYETDFQKFLPEFTALAQFKRSESLTFSYKQEVNFTDVNQIASGIVANSYNSFFYGTENLTNESVHNLNLNYRSFNLFNYTSIFARINYTKTIDQITTDADFIPGTVVRTSTSLNSPFDNESFSASARLGKTFKKLRGSLSANYAYSKNFQFFSDEVTEILRYVQSYRASLNTNYTNAPNISLRYGLSFNDQTSESPSSTNEFTSVTHSPTVSFDAYIWKSVTFKTDFSYNEVRQDGTIQNVYKIWDASLAVTTKRNYYTKQPLSF
ncbi:carboxypeptidase-like regulatory domain-containing protein [Polaribacter sp.]|nr:carboxypeptidase-like regulatory domain-containing protein [Polaribacter sp.]